MKKIIQFLYIFLISTQISCLGKNEIENNREEMIRYFHWEEGTNAPLGYPAEVYKGGLELVNGGYVSLYRSTISGKLGWGYPGNGSSNGTKALPNRLNVIYLSYAENQFYHVDAEIDYQNLVDVFDKPLYVRGASGKLRAEKFNQVIVGFAPGGVAVVWASGPGTIVEIGRYQGQKVTIPESETQYLDASEHLIFEKQWVEETMVTESIVPKEVQEANKNKPIPFGLWDTYRLRYHWMPVFQIQNNGTLGDFGFGYFNGEQARFYYENNQRSTTDPEMFYQKSEYNTLPIPKGISFSWFNKENEKYSGYFEFNEQEILKAFEVLTADDKNVEIKMLIRPSLSNNYAVVLLQASNGKEIAINQHIKDRFFKVKPRK